MAPFKVMAAGVKGDTSDSISQTGYANVPRSTTQMENVFM